MATYRPRTKRVNVSTSDLQVTNLADALWVYSNKLDSEIRQANVSSQFRDQLARVLTRLRHYAQDLGKSLEKPNDQAFVSADSTRQHLILLLDSNKIGSI